jgi:hypothetical protein
MRQPNWWKILKGILMFILVPSYLLVALLTVLVFISMRELLDISLYGLIYIGLLLLMGGWGLVDKLRRDL